MRAPRFAQLLTDLIETDDHPDVRSVASFTASGYGHSPIGFVLHLGTGGTVHLQITAERAPHDTGDAEPTPLHGPPPPALPRPHLRTQDGIPTAHVEAYLAALLTASRNPEIRAVEMFSPRNRATGIRFGLTVAYHDGSHTRANFVHALRAGRHATVHTRFQPVEVL